MTLDKHKLDGIPQIKSKTLPVDGFESLLRTEGYQQTATAPAQDNRIKVWWYIPPIVVLRRFTAATVRLLLWPITSLEHPLRFEIALATSQITRWVLGLIRVVGYRVLVGRWPLAGRRPSRPMLPPTMVVEYREPIRCLLNRWVKS